METSPPIVPLLLLLECSYRTYEEWKLFSSSRGAYFTVGVLTVPMRNGNAFVSSRIGMITFSFLPYLWGMETNIGYRIHKTKERFLPYLWGMETHSRNYARVRENMFLPYLWGMETTGSNSDTMKMCGFLPYLWGMETNIHTIICYGYFYVLTVPMRNGNFLIVNAIPVRM